jgi:hypothetical protein
MYSTVHVSRLPCGVLASVSAWSLDRSNYVAVYCRITSCKGACSYERVRLWSLGEQGRERQSSYLALAMGGRRRSSDSNMWYYR